jgi:DNA polymerase elongation subunit (family B)
MEQIDIVYPKKHPGSKEQVLALCEKWLSAQVREHTKTTDIHDTVTIESLFEKMAHEENEEDDSNNHNYNHNHNHNYNHNHNGDKYVKNYAAKKATIVDILCDKKFEREGKLNELNISLNVHFPKLEGDKVTFIGSTFMNYGEKEPFMNHCIVLNTCTEIPIENSVVESYSTEKEVLLAWQKLVQRENPDIIIGYNIFGFDYEFMFRRAEENNCIEDFMKLSRNKDELCCTRDNDCRPHCHLKTLIRS